MKEAPKVGDWVTNWASERWKVINAETVAGGPRITIQKDGKDGGLEKCISWPFYGLWLEEFDFPRNLKEMEKKDSPRSTEDNKAAEFLDQVIDTLRDRAKTYPAYSEEARKVAQVWNVLHDDDLDPKDVAELMLIVKLVRNSAGKSPDSLLDLVGYAARIRGML